jgi:hypothetical protein
VGINSTLQPASILAWIFAPMSGVFIAMLQFIFSLFQSWPASRVAHLRGFRQSQLCSRRKWLRLPSPAAGSCLVLMEDEGPKNMTQFCQHKPKPQHRLPV